MDSLEAGHAAHAGSADARDSDPARAPRPRRGRGGGRARGAALRPALARPARARRSSRRSRRASAPGTPARCPPARPALHLALRAVGRDATATRSSRRRSPSSRPPTSILYERATPVFADIDPRTLNLDPDAAAAAITARTTALLPVHIFGYPADVPALERHGLPIVEDACEALGAVHADGTPVGGRGHPAAFGFYANKQMTTGEGGMLIMGSRRAQGARRLRAQPGPRAGHGLARPRPARLQLPADRHRLRARPGPARPARRHARRPRARRRLVPRGARRPRRARRCRARTTAATSAAGSCSSSSSRAASTATTRSARWRALGVQSKPYLPAIHLMSLLPRALRPPRGRVPGLRGRRRALGRAAVLPGDDRGPGRPGRRGAAVRASTSGLEIGRRSPGPPTRARCASLAGRRIVALEEAEAR